MRAPIGPCHPDHPDPAPSLGTTPHLIPAARLIFTDAPPITVLPTTRAGWGNLCRILQLADLLARPDGLHLLLWPQTHHLQGGADDWEPYMRRLTRRFDKAIHLLLTPQYDGRDRTRFDELTTRAAKLGLPTLASAAPVMHHGKRRKLADVLSAIRLHRR